MSSARKTDKKMNELLKKSGELRECVYFRPAPYSNRPDFKGWVALACKNSNNEDCIVIKRLYTIVANQSFRNGKALLVVKKPITLWSACIVEKTLSVSVDIAAAMDEIETDYKEKNERR
jgi:hypothetical protein